MVKKSKDNKETKESKAPVKYIKQPYPVSEVRGNFTMQQTHILVEMMDQLQEKIESRMSEQQMQLFKDEDFDDNGQVHILVKFSDVVSRPDYYKEVEQLAKSMMQMYIKSEKEEEGSTVVELQSFIDKVSYTKKGSKRNYIKFSFNRAQVKQLFNLSRYSRYLKSVTKGAKNKYSVRLYMLMTSGRKFGKWNVSYNELRRIFGFDEYNAVNKKYEVVKYPQYKLFKAAVLKVAEKELRELAENGASDCWFEYEEHITPEQLSAKNKDGVVDIEENRRKYLQFEFILHTTEMGALEDDRREEARYNIELDKRLKEEFDQTPTQRRKILEACAGMLGELANKLDYLSKFLEGKDDKRGYANKALTEFVKELKKKEAAAAQADKDTKPVEDVVAEEVPIVTLTDEQRAEWGRALECVSEDWRGMLEPVEWGSDRVMVMMPAKASYEAFCGVEGKDKLTQMEQRLGKRILIDFRNKFS